MADPRCRRAFVAGLLWGWSAAMAVWAILLWYFNVTLGVCRG